jgi:hypothetical protein
MEPQQPYSTPPNLGQPQLPQQPVAPQQPVPPTDPYAFILNPEKPQRPSPLAGGSSLKRVGIFVGILAVLIIIAAVVASSLSGGTGKFTAITTVLQEQTELKRVATEGETNASQENTQELAYAVALSMASAEQQLTAYLSSNHQKIQPSALVLDHSKTVDAELTAALANSTYDSTFIGIIQNDLASYQRVLQTAYKADPGPKGRQLLSNQYDGATLLIKQSQSNN